MLIYADTLTNESEFLKNEDELKKVLVFAVEVEYEDDLVEYNLPDEILFFRH